MDVRATAWNKSIKFNKSFFFNTEHNDSFQRNLSLFNFFFSSDIA